MKDIKKFNDKFSTSKNVEVSYNVSISGLNYCYLKVKYCSLHT